MKLIYTNSITSVSSSAGALSNDYAIAKVQNNYPKQPYIANATSATVTVACSGAEAIFISYLAESVTVTFKTSGGSTISSESFSNSYDLSEAYLLNGKTHWNDSVFLDCPATTATVEIALSNSTNVRGNIDGWDQSSGALGRLEDGGAAIYFANYPQIRLGSFVNSYQINRLTGDGSGLSDVQLTSTVADVAVSSMTLPVVVNTIRAGKILETYNPNVGMGVQQESLGIQQQRDSGLVYRLGEIRRIYSGTVQVLESERATASAIFSGLRMQPVGAQILSYQTEATAVFGSFLEPPALTYSTQGSQIYDVSFELTELI